MQPLQHALLECPLYDDLRSEYSDLFLPNTSLAELLGGGGIRCGCPALWSSVALFPLRWCWRSAKVRWHSGIGFATSSGRWGNACSCVHVLVCLHAGSGRDGVVPALCPSRPPTIPPQPTVAAAAAAAARQRAANGDGRQPWRLAHHLHTAMSALGSICPRGCGLTVAGVALFMVTQAHA